MSEATENHAELRAHPRRHVELDITFESDSQFYNGFSENISEGGVFIATFDVRPIGAQVDVTFTLPTSRQKIHAECEVRWLRPYAEGGLPRGMGLHFRALKPEDTKAIRAFCTQREPLFYEE